MVTKMLRFVNVNAGAYMVYDVFWDEKQRLFLVALRGDGGPKALRVVTSEPDGAERILALAPVVRSDVTGAMLVPTAAVHVPDTYNWIRVEPIVTSTGGVVEFNVRDYIATFKLRAESFESAERQRSYWTVTNKSAESLLRVTPTRSHAIDLEEAEANGDIVYETILSGDAVVPGHIAGSKDDAVIFEVQINRDTDLYGRPEDQKNEFELSIALAKGEPPLKRPVEFAIYQMLATADVQPALVPGEDNREPHHGEARIFTLKPEDTDGVAVTLPFPDADATDAPSLYTNHVLQDDDDDASPSVHDDSWGFLDRLVIETEDPITILFRGELDPDHARTRKPVLFNSHTMVLAYYEDRFVIDRGKLATIVENFPILRTRHDGHRKGWRPHDDVAKLIGEDLAKNHELLMPTAAAYVILCETVLQRETARADEALRKLPANLDAFTKFAAPYFLLLDKQFYEAAGQSPSEDTEQWLLETCERVVRLQLEKRGDRVSEESLAAWIKTFENRAWTLCELIMTGAAADLALYRVCLPDVLATSFVRTAKPKIGQLADDHLIEATLKRWKYADSDASDARSLEDALSHGDVLRRRETDFAKSFDRAVNRCALFSERRTLALPDRPEEDEPQTELASLARDKFLKDLASEDLEDGCKQAIALHFALQLEDECHEIQIMADEFELTPELMRGHVAFRALETAAVPGFQEGVTAFERDAEPLQTLLQPSSVEFDDPLIREIGSALDRLEQLRNSEFRFIERTVGALIAALEAMRKRSG